MSVVEIRRAYRKQESLVRYWAEQAVHLCVDIEDESLDGYAEPVRAAMEALQHDRRIIVIGGTGSGKSSVLAGIAGVPVIGRCRMPGLYLCWRSLCRDGDVSHSRFLPLPWLNGLELVDTSGCTPGPAQDTCRALLQCADVVVAVVDARAPENSPVWELLSDMPAPLLSTCVLAVTHADELSTEAAVGLKSIMQELIQTRLNAAVACYIVNPGDARSMAPLRDHVGATMQEAYVLRTSIRSLVDRAIELVDKQSRVLRVRHSTSQTDNSFISSIDQEIDNFQAYELKELNTHQDSLDAAVQKVIDPVLDTIRYRMGWALSPTALLRLELMGADTDRALYRQMEQAVRAAQEGLDKNFTSLCASHWKTVQPRMKATLDFDIGAFPETDLEQDLSDLRKRLGQDMREPFSSSGLRHRFFHLFIAQAGWMRACMIFLCFLLMAAGVLGFVGQDALGVCCVVAALLVWLGGSVGHHLAYRHICKQVVLLTEDLRKGMAISMRNVLERLTISRVAAYRRLYTKPRQKVARRDSMLKPLQEQQNKIHIQLRTLAPRI